MLSTSNKPKKWDYENTMRKSIENAIAIKMTKDRNKHNKKTTNIHLDEVKHHSIIIK